MHYRNIHLAIMTLSNTYMYEHVLFEIYVSRQQRYAHKVTEIFSFTDFIFFQNLVGGGKK